MTMTSLWFPDTGCRTAVQQQNNNIQGYNPKRNHFVQAGIEKKSGATGFAYGSEQIQDKKFIRRSSLKDEYKMSPGRVKLKKQRKEFDESHQTYLEQKKAEKQKRLEEQRKDLEQLQQYYPWGKPAGGAPRYTPSGAPQARILRHLPQVDTETGYNPYGRPGAGAPLRTASGKIATQIKGAQDIGFPDHLKGDTRIGERKTKATKTLQKTLDRTESEKLEIAEERHKKLAYGKRLEEQRLEAIARRERDKKELLDAPTEYIWGRDKVCRDQSGKLPPRKVVINSDAYTSRQSAAGSSSIASQMMRGVQRKAANKPHDKNTINDVTVDEFDPWGKPGAGAPLRDGAGHVKASGVYGKHSRDKRSAHLTVPLDKMAASRGYGVDMATIMRGQLSKPIVNKSQEKDDTGFYTDLQAEAEKRSQQRQALSGPAQWSKVGGTRLLNEDDLARNKEYSNELRKAIDEKNLQRKRSRENNIAMEKQHALVFAEHWGRPGAGAPRTDGRGRVEAVHRSMDTLQAQVHTNQHFRN